MSKRESIIRYQLIIRKLNRSYCTFKEIKTYLENESQIQGYDLDISLRTFQRDIQDISAIYNIDIKYSKAKQAYFIEDYGTEEFTERIFEAFDTFNALNITDRLASYVQLEKRKPLGTENLYGVLHAIKNYLTISFSYQKYWEGTITNRSVEPYALKEFRNRWYVLAKDLKDGILKTFALDRLKLLEITNQGFDVDINIDIETYFKHCFGIVKPNPHEQEKPEEIILKFTAFQGKYIKSLPFHESQEILVDTDEELTIKLYVYPTHDLFMEILSYGANVKVVKPEIMANQIKEEINRTLKNYI